MAIEIVAQRPRHVAILIECDALVGATIDRASEDATLPNPELSGESRVPDPKSRVSSPPANPESQIPSPRANPESQIPNPEHYLRSIRLSFSTSVVRFRLSSRAACPLFPPVRSSDR